MNALVDGLARSPLHVRRIEMKGCRRSDGLFEVEGRIIDTKPFDYALKGSNRLVPVGESVHDISLVLVFDETMIVRDVRTSMLASPYPICPAAGQSMRALIGLKIGPGWNSATRKVLLTAERCTHMAEMLAPLATTAIQTMSSMRTGHDGNLDTNGRPVKIDSCYAYGANREIVRDLWPEHFNPAAPES